MRQPARVVVVKVVLALGTVIEGSIVLSLERT